MGYQVKYKMWIEADGASFLGSGRIRLLKSVDQLGSLSKAAAQLNISYKKAWDLIKSVNDAAQEPVTITETGGSGGGGMKLTPYGQKIIEQFEQVKAKANDFIDEQHFEG
jgi:molybdate transport system regulatory protein